MISRAFHPNKNSENYGSVTNGWENNSGDNPGVGFPKSEPFNRKFPEGKSNGTEIPSKKVPKMSVETADAKQVTVRA